MTDRKDEELSPLLPLEGIVTTDDNLCVDEACIVPDRSDTNDAKASATSKPPEDGR